MISMLRKTLVEIAKSTIMIEEKMLIRKKSIVRFCQDSDNDEIKRF